MGVKAPFHVGTDFQRDWHLFSFHAEVVGFERVQWDYWLTQELATQSEQLRLRSNFEKWRARRKFCRKRRVDKPAQ